MADVLSVVAGLFSKRYKDMGDGSHAEVVSAVLQAGALALGKVSIDQATQGVTN